MVNTKIGTDKDRFKRNKNKEGNPKANGLPSLVTGLKKKICLYTCRTQKWQFTGHK